tara:strand:+ start:32007 stop:32954 length:948 start_codon:yes stop_codon:yes gene_type:complete
MLKMIDENEEPPSINTSPEQSGDVPAQANSQSNNTGLFSKVTSFFKPKSDPTLRETIEEYIDGENDESEHSPFSDHEKKLLSNVLELHDTAAADVMIPRADIIGVSVDTTQKELLELLAEKQYSRFPVYKDTLDNVVGALHIKDILACIARNEPVDIGTLIRDIPVISPSMHILDLLLQMRITRKHLVLVVDEFGGIDGLITLGDLIESIVGDIDDEHNPEDQPEIVQETDGTVLADARVNLQEFEEEFGDILNEEERQENETLGGLVFYMAGRVPVRGEVLKHDTGMMFEVLEADPRRVSRLRIRNIPVMQESE